MKIERLWKDKVFRIAEEYPNKYGGRTIPDMNTATKLTTENLKVGTEIHTGTTGRMSHDTWLIIKDFGNGKFRAIASNPETFQSSNIFNKAKELGILKRETFPINDISEELRNNKPFADFLSESNMGENFDLYNTDLERHFVYKLNEEAIPKEARKMGLEVEKITTQRKTGFNEWMGDEWWKIKIPKERAKMPVTAFGKIATSPLMIGAGASALAVGASQYYQKKRSTFSRKQ